MGPPIQAINGGYQVRLARTRCIQPIRSTTRYIDILVSAQRRLDLHPQLIVLDEQGLKSTLKVAAIERDLLFQDAYSRYGDRADIWAFHVSA